MNTTLKGKAILLLVVALLLQACAQSQAPSPTGRYTTSMFRRALTNESTAPDFVLITVTDTRRGTTRVVCTEAPFLEGALHTEHGIPYDKPGIAHIRKFTLSQPDRSFTFSKPKAITNVTPYYTPEILNTVRAVIRAKSDHELLNTDFVQTLYTSKPQNQYAAYRDAVGHALLERGISCRRGCIVGNLTPYK